MSGKRKLRFHVKAATRNSQQPKVPVELVVNGLPVEKKMVATDGSTKRLEFEVEIDKSSWVAVRVFPHAHTNPIFVLVDEKPIRANKHSAEWMLRGVDECWKQKERTYHKSELEDAKKAYEHARVVYRKIISEHEKSNAQ